MAAWTAGTEPLVCLGSQPCHPLSTMSPRIAMRGGWRGALPNTSLVDQRGVNCLLCDEPAVRQAMGCSHLHPREMWDLSGGVSNVTALGPGLDWTLGEGGTVPPGYVPEGYVPDLRPGYSLHAGEGWRLYAPKSKQPVMLPCSSARGEDAAVIRTFFTDAATTEPLRFGTFLVSEAQGGDGAREEKARVRATSLHA